MAQLGEAFHEARERAGLSLLEVYVGGREHEELYQLAEALMDLDEWLQTWRIRHYRVVARVIGEHVDRHAGDAGGGARPADPSRRVPGVVGRPQRVDRKSQAEA